jgi:predicted DNA-binding ribbon-helix-helix protein
MGQRRAKRKPKKDFVKTTIYLERDLWKELKWEAIEKQTTLSELINRKLKELKSLKRKTPIVAEDL